MFKIRIEKLVDKPIEVVFDYLADHENYTRFKGITSSVLLAEGAEDKNGTGALREIKSGPVAFEERITHYDRPTQLHYLIEKSTPFPFAHDKGEISLSAEGDKTRVIWISEGHVNLPIVGSLILDKYVNKQGTAAFSGMLDWIHAYG